MKKHISLTITALLLALLLLGIGAPKIVGLLVFTPEFETRLRDVTGQSQLMLTAESGWFRRTAQVRVVEPTIAGVHYERQEIRAEMSINHGPFMWTSQGLRFGLAWVELVPSSDNSDMNSVITNLNINKATPLTMLVKIDGSLQLALPMREVSLTNSNVLSGHAHLQAQLDLTTSGLASVSLSASDLQLESDDIQLNAQSIALNLQTERLDQAAIPGSTTVDVRELHISSEQSLTIDRISLDYSALPEQEDGTFSLRQHITVENIVSELPVTDLNWFTNISNINSELAYNYIQFVRESSATGYVNFDPVQAQRLSTFIESSTLLLAQNPIAMHSTLSAEAYDGQHEAELTVDWPGLPDLKRGQNVPFAEALVALEATFGLKADAEAVKKTPFGGTVDVYIDQGVLPVTQGMIEVSASLSDGTIHLNDQTIALKPFLDL